MFFDLLSLTIIISLMVGIIFGVMPLLLSLVIAPKSCGGEIGSAYECGVIPYGHARISWGINYYFYALLFLAFDVDVLYLFPIAIEYPMSQEWTILWELIIFVGVLSLAVVYFWRKGVFTWPRRINL